MSREMGRVAVALDAGMVVVTTAAAGERSGCLVGFHSQSSIDPPRYAVWLSKANHTYRVALEAEWFAVHFLAVSDRAVADWFGSLTADDVDKFGDVEWHEGTHGEPLLDVCPNRLIGRRVSLTDDGSDHVCVNLDAVEVTLAGGFTPLRFTSVADIDPGHDPHDRQG